MITIITGSNRRKSEATFFAKEFQQVLQSKTKEMVHLIDMMDIPADIWHPDMYDKTGQAEAVTKIQDEKMIPAEKFLFVVPEYNGSFPGSVKLFLDAVSVRAYKDTFHYKKAALVGIATGRAGNLRGLEHLTGILNHLGVIVMPNKIPISKIGQLTDDNKTITDLDTIKVMNQFSEEFIDF